MRLTNEIFKRCKHNPIITYRSMPYVCQAVFNPGACMVGDETLLLLRVEDLEGRSHLTVARSADGIGGWRIDNKPLLAPSDEAGPYEEFGCEDPRVTWLEDLGRWVIAYTAYSPFGAGVALATTDDFKQVDRLGLVLAPNNKDAAVFPRKIKGRYWMLHRPVAGTIEHIWLTDSTDLVHWGHPWCIIMERGGPMWDGVKVGANTPPIETDEGWLILYHGVKQFSTTYTYRMGVALLDLDDPRRLIARMPHWVLGPHEHYEVTGAVPNVVFPCGHTVVGDEVRVYYGAADTSVGLATASLAEMLDELRKYRV
ncbi:MAG: glycoside hydrolase family 130 protein [Armatimonadota bacterium]